MIAMRRLRATFRLCPLGIASESGATLLEFAISGLILFTLVFGIMVMSIALYSFHFVASAARDAARYAMVRGSSCATYGGFSSDCPIADSSSVQNYVRSLGFPGINSSNLAAAVTWSNDGITWTSTAALANDPGDYIKVKITYQLPISIPFVPSRVLTVSSTAETVIAD